MTSFETAKANAGCYRTLFETAKADAQSRANKTGVIQYVWTDRHGSWFQPMKPKHDDYTVIEPQKPPSLSLHRQIEYARLHLIQGRELASLHRRSGHPERILTATEASVCNALAVLTGETDEQREAKS